MNNKGKIAITVLIMLVLVASAFVVFSSKKVKAVADGDCYCEDTDGGYFPETAGAVLNICRKPISGLYDDIWVNQDTCEGQNTLAEWSCDDYGRGSNIDRVDCRTWFGNEGGVCQNGACVYTAAN